MFLPSSFRPIWVKWTRIEKGYWSVYKVDKKTLKGGGKLAREVLSTCFFTAKCWTALYMVNAFWSALHTVLSLAGLNHILSYRYLASISLASTISCEKSWEFSNFWKTVVCPNIDADQLFLFKLQAVCVDLIHQA